VHAAVRQMYSRGAMRRTCAEPTKNMYAYALGAEKRRRTRSRKRRLVRYAACGGTDARDVLVAGARVRGRLV
jgi:hypothetical protein